MDDAQITGRPISMDTEGNLCWAVQVTELNIGINIRWALAGEIKHVFNEENITLPALQLRTRHISLTLLII